MVLQRADGVAFVADSHPGEAESNFASFDNLERNLALVGLDIETLPLVIQFNKRDLPQAVSERDIRNSWEPTGIPVLMASALNGERRGRDLRARWRDWSGTGSTPVSPWNPATACRGRTSCGSWTPCVTRGWRRHDESR